MPSIIGLCHNFSHFPNSCYSIMGGTHAIEHRPNLEQKISEKYISFYFIAKRIQYFYSFLF
jgi:hypothetical protein